MSHLKGISEAGENKDASAPQSHRKNPDSSSSHDGSSQKTNEPPTQRRKSRADYAMSLTHAVRKLSVFRRLSIAPSIGRRGSVATLTDMSSVLSQARIPEKLENTYQLGPVDGQRFNADHVRKVVTGILNSYLDGEDYEEKKCTLLARNLGDVIKSRVKDMDIPRYKIVCVVTIGQIGDEGLNYASRCLWNVDTDNYATGTYQNSTLFCVASVYGIYFE